MTDRPRRVGSLFSGCGGMDLGLDRAGFGPPAWQVEIDRHASAVLAYHWPGVTRYTDIREVSVDELAAVSLIAGGSPCQDLSVAGKRAGLDGERSGLFHHFVRIADSQPSAWVLWENVDGALSTNDGEDFAIVLGEFSGFRPGVPVDGWRSAGFGVGPKRWLVWRVLDSQHFGVPQRRKRLFVVGGPRNGRGMGGAGQGDGSGFRGVHPELLLEPDCLRGASTKGGGSREGIAGSLTSGASRGGGWRAGADEAAAGQVIAQLVTGMQGSGGNRSWLGPDEPHQTLNCHDKPNIIVSHALNTRSGGRMDPNGETWIIKGAAIGRAPESGPQFGEVTDGPCFTLNCTEVHAVAHALRASYDASEDGTGRGTPLVPVPYHLAQITHPENRANPQPDDPAPSLNGDARLAIVGSFNAKAGGDMRGLPQRIRDQAGTVNAKNPPAVFGIGVRRLTERECERLQAYPDDWTRRGPDGKEISSGQRYKMIGNGVTASVAEWIGRRILAAQNEI